MNNSAEQIRELLDSLGLFNNIDKKEIDELLIGHKYSLQIVDGNYVIKLFLKRIPDITLFSKIFINFKGIQKARQNDSRRFRIQFEIHDKTSNKDLLFQYLDFYVNRWLSDNKTLVIWLKKKLFDYANGDLVIHYEEDNQKKELEKINTGIIDFLLFAGFLVKSHKLAFIDTLATYKANVAAREEQTRNEINTLINAQTDLLAGIKKNNKEIINSNRYKQIDIKDIDLSLGGNYIIKGKIFNIETKNTEDKDQYNFFLNDSINAIITYASVFKKSKWANPRPCLTVPYLNCFKVGEEVSVAIKINAERQAAYIDAILLSPTPKRQTIEYENNRIELLARSKYGNLDGIIDLNEYIQYGTNHNWPFIITADDSCVQSYPKYKLYTKATKIKPIYACEVNEGSKWVEIVKQANDKDFNINTPVIILDIETTGLSCFNNEITEIGAIKIEGGNTVKEFQTFVAVKNGIPAKITEITKITNEMLKNAPSLKEALQKLLEFVGADTPIIAHNGIDFDIPFINEKLKEVGLPKLTNPILDSMILSQAINGSSTKHSIVALCTFYKIKYSRHEAHRAVVDCKYLFSIYANLLKQLPKGVNTLNNLNKLLQSDNLIKYQSTNPVIIYIKDVEGIKPLYHTLTLALTKYNGRNPVFLLDNLKQFRQHYIICNSPEVNSDIWISALEKDDRKLKQLMDKYDYIFISPPDTYLYMVADNRLTLQQIKENIKYIYDIATELDKKVIAVSNAFYINEEDLPAFEIIRHAKKETTNRSHRFYDEGNSNTYIPKLHVRSTKEMINELSFIDKNKINDIVVTNTHSFIDNFKQPILPIPDGLHTPTVENAAEKLKQPVYQKAQEIYGEKMDEYIKKRIDDELKILSANNYEIFYLVAMDLVKELKNKGSIVGARGSVNSTIIAWLLGIGDINPLPPHYICDKCKYTEFHFDFPDVGGDMEDKVCPKCGTILKKDGFNIPYETFLGFPTKEGKSSKTPDIDMNFGEEYQAIAHQYIKDRFGENRAVRVGTISKLQEKKVKGIIRSYIEECGLTKEFTPAQQQWIISRLAGVKINNGQHAGGIIITPNDKEIEDFTPCIYLKDKETGGFVKTTHFDGKDITDNLLKFDILGHTTPSTLLLLNKLTNIHYSMIPLNDKKVISLFSSLKEFKMNDVTSIGTYKTGVLGMPELGADYSGTTIISACNISSLADIVRVMGISHGESLWRDVVKNLLTEQHLTLQEIMCCRDDITNFLRSKGIESSEAFYMSEIIRNPKKKLSESQIVNMKNHNVPEWYINACDKIVYMFPKAHAAAYAINAYYYMWYKLYHPIQFYAAYFSGKSIKSFDAPVFLKGETELYLKYRDLENAPKEEKEKNKKDLKVFLIAIEMIKRGFTFAPVDINKSDSKHFVIEGNKLIIPFLAIDKLGDIVAKDIIEERKKGPFTSKENFLFRTKVSKSVVEQLVKIDTFANIPEFETNSLFD